MSGYAVLTAVIIVAGLVPAVGLTAVGRPVDRLIGLELTSASVVAAMLLLSVVSNRPYELVVPLALVPLSAVGTLVFTRLVGRVRRDP